MVKIYFNTKSWSLPATSPNDDEVAGGRKSSQMHDPLDPKLSTEHKSDACN